MGKLHTLSQKIYISSQGVNGGNKLRSCKSNRVFLCRMSNRQWGVEGEGKDDYWRLDERQLNGQHL